MAFSSDFERPGDHRMDEDEDMDDDDDDDEYDSLHTYKAMVPFANIIPADYELANCEFSPSEGSISLVTTKDIPAGATLCVDPGPLPRSDLLRRMGKYSQSSTQHDVVEIDSTLIISVAGKALSDSVRDARIERLVDEDALEDSYDIETDGGIPSEILVLIQAFVVDDQTFQSYVEDEKFPKAKRDERTRDLILEVIAKRREGYRTTVEQDLAFLSIAGAGLGTRKRMAIEVRLGEKKILDRVENMVRGWADEPSEGSRKRQKR
ncbi:hypothetical protein ABW20_dc0104772 [Dactylellina cionopaga]|nr:hypothetical protein ABW20_dc0104772 [Dactylellina cionopaga]